MRNQSQFSTQPRFRRPAQTEIQTKANFLISGRDPASLRYAQRISNQTQIRRRVPVGAQTSSEPSARIQNQTQFAAHGDVPSAKFKPNPVSRTTTGKAWARVSKPNPIPLRAPVLRNAMIN